MLPPSSRGRSFGSPEQSAQAGRDHAQTACRGPFSRSGLGHGRASELDITGVATVQRVLVASVDDGQRAIAIDDQSPTAALLALEEQATSAWRDAKLVEFGHSTSW